MSKRTKIQFPETEREEDCMAFARIRHLICVPDNFWKPIPAVEFETTYDKRNLEVENMDIYVLDPKDALACRYIFLP